MSRHDPGATNGLPIDTSQPARCTCGHIAGVHTPRPSNPRVRGACTAHTPDACPCPAYRPDTQETTR